MHAGGRVQRGSIGGNRAVCSAWQCCSDKASMQHKYPTCMGIMHGRACGVGRTKREGLELEVGVLAAGHLMVVHVGGAGAQRALERRVQLARLLPEHAQFADLAEVQPGVQGRALGRADDSTEGALHCGGRVSRERSTRSTLAGRREHRGVPGGAVRKRQSSQPSALGRPCAVLWPQVVDAWRSRHSVRNFPHVSHDWI